VGLFFLATRRKIAYISMKHPYLIESFKAVVAGTEALKPSGSRAIAGSQQGILIFEWK
jgi:hypothetical protein